MTMIDTFFKKIIIYLKIKINKIIIVNISPKKAFIMNLFAKNDSSYSDKLLFLIIKINKKILINKKIVNKNLLSIIL